MSQALYRKWRPQKWDEVVGQQHVVQTLRNAVSGGRVAHAYLFAGPRGTGKTTAARLLAKAVNCLDPDPAEHPCNKCDYCKAVNDGRFLDLIEIDAASQTGVEDVRDLRDKINFTPNQGKYKIYIIDEVHMFSNSAFNALLKTLEEPPPHAIFILATTEIHKIPATVLSRCQRHEFRRVPVELILSQLENIAKNEKIKAEPEALVYIARQSAGGLRDAISLLDQLASTGQTVNLELAHAVLGTATSQTVLGLVDAVVERNPAAGMEAIHSSLDSGTDARSLARQVVEYLRGMLLIHMGNSSQVDLPAEVRQRAEAQAKVLTSGEILRMIKIFNIAASDPRGSWQPSLPMELALAEVMETPSAAPLAAAPLAAAASTEVNMTKKFQAEPAVLKPQKMDQAQEIPQPPAESTGKVTLGQMMKSWKQVGAAVKSNMSLAALLNSCTLLELKNNVLTLGFKSDILRAKADTPEQVESLCKAIREVTGEDLAVRCVVSDAKRSSTNVKANGMVAAAIKHGGEIVDIQE